MTLAGAPARSRPRPRLVVAMVASSMALLSAGIAATLATPGALSDADAWSDLSFLPSVTAFSVVGGLIALRRPENIVGWLMATIGLLFAVVTASSSASRWALETGALPKALGQWILVASNAWVPALGLIGTQLPLRLPDGKLPSAGWRWYSRATLALIAVSMVGMAAQPPFDPVVPGTSNPLHAEWAEPLAAAFLLVIGSFVGGLAALVVRYRRARARERVQLRWVAFGGVVFLVVYIATFALLSLVGLPEDSAGGQAITSFSQLAFGALAIAIGYAVLRHRLYDIDVVINRTLVYGGLTAILAGAYLAGVLLLQLVLSGVNGGSSLAVAGTTLAVAALFRPARARVQEAVDRRFFRRRYDAGRTLAAFSARLRDEVELDTLEAELRALVAETVQPAHVSLWLRPDGSPDRPSRREALR